MFTFQEFDRIVVQFNELNQDFLVRISDLFEEINQKGRYLNINSCECILLSEFSKDLQDKIFIKSFEISECSEKLYFMYGTERELLLRESVDFETSFKKIISEISKKNISNFTHLVSKTSISTKNEIHVLLSMVGFDDVLRSKNELILCCPINIFPTVIN